MTSALCTVTCVPCLLLLFFPTFQTAEICREKNIAVSCTFLQRNFYICRRVSVKTGFANSRVPEWLAPRIHRVEVALTSPQTANP